MAELLWSCFSLTWQNTIFCAHGTHQQSSRPDVSQPALKPQRLQETITGNWLVFSGLLERTCKLTCVNNPKVAGKCMPAQIGWTGPPRRSLTRRFLFMIRVVRILNDRSLAFSRQNLFGHNPGQRALH